MQAGKLYHRSFKKLFASIAFGAAALIGPSLWPLTRGALKEIGLMGAIAAAMIGSYHWAAARDIERNVEPNKIVGFTG